MKGYPILNLARTFRARLFMTIGLVVALVSPAAAISVEHGHDASHVKSSPAVKAPIWLEKLEQSPFFKGKSFSHVKFDQVADKDRVRTFVISTDFEGETNESVSAAL